MIYNRRQFIRNSTTLTGLSLLPWQQDMLRLFLPEAGEMKLLRNNVGIYTERGGTIGWMIAPEGIVVIDTQFKEQSENLIAKIREKSDHKIDLVINTHHHGDHSSGNIAFKGLVDKVVAHKNSKANQERVAKSRDQEETQLYPDTTFDQEWSQRVGGEIITMRYFGPAHTDGDSVTHFENANIVHMGDLMFNRRFPFIDKTAGASIENWIQVLAKTIKQFDKDTLYIFGHAGEGYDVTGTQADLKGMQKYLKDLLKYVKKGMKAGKTQEELSKNLEMIPGSPEWKGSGVERSISAAWQELGGE